ncbi:HNH endonuclease family protein [Planktomarina sp.]|nr:HNH endonuclease family protein [Planktomarina sp.]MDA9100064.1 HNH endonuclease family protein [Planktomarina sp.]
MRNLFIILSIKDRPMYIKFLSLFVFLASFAQAANCEEIPKYDRDLFGGWSDIDHDCQNTRHELLQELSTSRVVFSTNTCRVVKGRWLVPYTDITFFESKFVDIDHLVPLKYSWDRGSYKWSDFERAQFSNDPSNLFVVEKSVNREKAALGPSKWLPPNIKFRCDYIRRFQHIIKKYRLVQSAAERRLIKQVQQQHCD